MRDITAAGTPSAGEKSTVLPADTLQADNATGTEETRSLLDVAGTTQVSIAQTTDASAAARDGYHMRFTSEPLAAGTYGSGTWTTALAVQQSNAQANTFSTASVYFWDGSAVVGFVYDSDTVIGNEWRQSEEGEVNTITGSNVTIGNGDVLVYEVWRHQVQQMATARTCTIFFEGATDPVDDTATTDAASFIQAPADIPLFSENPHLIVNPSAMI